ncbi:MAG TPA: hypothetical protein VNL14_16505 [Candidatus Acidoferrales bacterium]|nr:hypothetical protein [Candidatus Acidoferrales bacterium]
MNCDLTQLCREIARELTIYVDVNETWTFQENTHWAGHFYIKEKGGMELSFAHTKGRLVIHGLYPRYSDGRVFYYSQWEEIKKANVDSITTDPNRDPRSQAAEIRRRLLPGYRTLYAEAVKRVNAEENWAAEKEQAVKEICELLGENCRPDYLRRDAQPQLGNYGGVQAIVTSATSIKITMSASSLMEARAAISALMAIKTQGGVK